MTARTERWRTQDGRLAVMDVRHDETVLVSYELLAGMLTELGLAREESE